MIFLSQAYQRHKDDPPIPWDMPPVAGKISWARQLFRRIQEPMDVFKVGILTLHVQLSIIAVV